MESELTAQEMALIKALADEWRKSGPPGFVETTELAKALIISVPETKSMIHSLFIKGLVGTDKLDIHAAYLTPEGFDIAQS